MKRAIARERLFELSRAHPDRIPDYAVPKGMSKDEFLKRHIDMLSSPWFKYLVNYDPVPILQKVHCPVLALNGDKDVQVPSKENLEGLETALKAGGNRDVTIFELPGLNHAFQECKTGMPDEYGQISQTFSPSALAVIQTWLATHTTSHLEN